MLLKKNSTFWKDTNEERKMLEAHVLYKEVKKCPKLSHVLISFEGYEDHLLNYQILLAHKKKEWKPPFNPIVHFKPERVRSYGKIELCDFQLSLETVPELFRADYSIDLFKTRKTVVSVLTEVFGSIRDYYGSLLEEKENNLDPSIEDLV